ncbi:class IV lanthionine synthetase LanL [Kitasatospora sp. NPDC088346]|uniref:class IV lanthionine synthetase LanL n=1 Tax=Kitasatospora sp. NPDC088346 TaxID=3364073 RepID=UPI0037FA1FBA
MTARPIPETSSPPAPPTPPGDPGKARHTVRGGSVGADAALLPGLLDGVIRGQGACGWTVRTEGFWCLAGPAGGQVRQQGWKLHLSATPLSAAAVLVRAAGVLVAERAFFKFAGTLDRVAELVSGRCDRGSGGKFITVYPDDDDHFRRLAEKLDRATRALPGPAVLSDRRYRPDSLVYYRYGVFGGISRLGNDGSAESMLETPDGRFVRDVRRARFSPPDWAQSPLPPPGDGPGSGTEPDPGTEPAAVLLDGRFVVRKAIRHAYKGGVYLATDQDTGRQVVIKEARRHVGGDLEGTDAAHLLHHEAAMQAALSALGVCPRALGVFTQGGHLYLAQERVEGRTLREWVADRPAPAEAVLIDLAGQLLALVDRVHRAGHVLRDLNPNNIMRTPDGTLQLIDLEMVARPGERARRAYTLGYAAPEVVASEPIGPAPAQSSDLFSLGAVLLHLATGADLVFAEDEPRTRPADGRVAALVTRALADSTAGRTLTPIVLGLTADAPDERWSLATVRQFLSEASTGGRTHPGATGGRAPGPTTAEAEERLLADGLAHLLNTMTPADPQRLWPAEGFGALSDPLNVQYGAAGVLAVLTAAATVRDDPRLRDGTGDAARWIAAGIRPDDRTLPGLYFGRSGTAWALLDAAALLDDDALEAAALRLARRIPVRWPNPDVCHGAAGAGLAHLHFWRTTGEPDFRRRVVETGEGLLAAAEQGGAGVVWPIPKGFDSALAGVTHLGFGHGVAGIGTFLLAAGLATGRDDFVDLARRAGDTLVAAARGDADTAWWPASDTDAEPPFQPPYWCSGSSGVGTFLIRLWQATADRRFLDLALKAAAEVYRTRWQMSPAACHGLAGNGEFLLDLVDATGDPLHRRRAEELAHCAQLRHTLRHGLMLLPDESMTGLTVGYHTGMSGALALIVRLRHGGGRLWLPETPELPAPPAGSGAGVC